MRDGGGQAKETRGGDGGKDIYLVLFWKWPREDLVMDWMGVMA